MKKRLIFCVVLLILVGNVFAQDNSRYDMNGDNKINLEDIRIIAFNFLKIGFDSKTDVNSDGTVNLFDIVLSAKHMGQTVETPTGNNIINNPSFETRDAGYPTGWHQSTDGAAALTTGTPASQGTYAAKYSITVAGGAVQVYQIGVPLEAYTQYVLTFDAYSNSGNNIVVKVHRHDSPYTNYGIDQWLDLGTSWQPYSFTFTTNSLDGRSSVTDGRLRFWFQEDAAGDVYWIDNIVLTKIGEASPSVCTDNDGDGYRIEGGSCGPVDCNDGNSGIHPGAYDACGNGVDENCDGPDSVCPPTGSSVSFAVIGDFGSGSGNAQRVATMIAGWDPDFIITVGDNNYPDGEAATIDQNIGKYYSNFIGNYQGSYGSGSATNRFWPTLGNHDWHVANAQPYIDYFTLPGNEYYYDVDKGLVHLFAVDSDYRQPDGRSASSIQGNWLQNQLASSTACFDVVYFHHAPYSSGNHGGTSVMQWPFENWGG